MEDAFSVPFILSWNEHITIYNLENPHWRYVSVTILTVVELRLSAGFQKF